MSTNDEIMDALRKVGPNLEMHAEKTRDKLNEISARMGELEQYVVGIKPTSGAPAASSRIGQLAAAVKDNDAVTAFKERRQTSARIPLDNYRRPSAAITSDGATPAINPFPGVRPGIEAPLLETLAIEDLIPHVDMTTGSIEWLREKAGADVRAAVQAAQGVRKKEGTLAFEAMESKAATAAVFLKFSKQVLDDQSGLAKYVEQRLSYGLDDGIDDLLLNGTGTNGENEGMLLPANHTALDPAGLGANAPMFDYIRRGKTQIRIAKGAAGSLLLHPSDAEAMDLTKDSEGRYMTGGPVDASGRVWGLTPVETTQISEGQFVVADFQRAAVFFDRMAAMLILGYSEDDMVKNLVTMLMERRFAVSWNRPSLIIVGSFTGAT
ncbi:MULTISPECIES: phage major capsid protein [unclassified Caballeronia]|uniref:phage major capsid protein n=1 Tax=unclassified Caballeronia TaxID=2646786 RepID=UPI0028597926|nr:MULTISPECIES: phage major capsid protein [unclassified Caballeronia]MDR5770862.1 phage major capsid protein [Caballeronia sp. LZ002]MDR5846299.1 phage major capsid protein [Caballeronia sp. LZ003]